MTRPSSEEAGTQKTEYQLLLMKVSWWDRNVKVIKEFGYDLWIIVRNCCTNQINLFLENSSIGVCHSFKSVIFQFLFECQRWVLTYELDSRLFCIFSLICSLLQYWWVQGSHWPGKTVNWLRSEEFRSLCWWSCKILYVICVFHQLRYDCYIFQSKFDCGLFG